MLITIDLGAAGGANLHKRKAALVGGVKFEKVLDASEALQNSLGVVEAIDADPQQACFDAEFGAERGAFVAGVAPLERFRRGLRKRDTDRVGAHASHVASAVDGETIPFGESFEGAVHCCQEIIAVRLDVETDEIGSQKAIQQFALPGADAEDFGIGPGDMPEDGYASVGARFLDHAGKQREVIVLDEDDGRFGAFHFLEHGVGKVAIHALVIQPILGPKDRARVRDVTERPQTLVGKAFVVALLLRGGEPDAAQRVARVIRRNAETIVGIDGFAIGVAGTVRDPGAVAGEQHRFERGHQSAGRNQHADCMILLLEDMHVGLAIGDDEERLVRRACCGD